MQEDQLQAIFNKTYARADSYIQYLLYSFLGVGICIASFNGTWIAALGTGTIILVAYLLSKLFLRTGTLHVIITGFCFASLGAQIIHQLNGLPELHNLFFILLTGLTIYESRKIYIPLFIAIVTIHISSIILAETSLSFNFLPESSQNLTSLLFYYSVLIFGMLISSWIAGFLRSRTIKYFNNKQEYEDLNFSYLKNIEFANEIASGNLEVAYSNSKDDILGKSLREMRDKLNASSIEVKNRNWAAEGIAKIEEILRLNNNNLENLSYSVISHLVKYLKANQGAVFIMNTETENELFLELKGCYAYEKKKYINKQIKPGEGLIGQSVMEKNVILLKEVPDDYVQITSGLGEATPRCIVIIPLQMEDQVVGAIELATFHHFLDFQVEFLQNVAESIASAVLNSKNNQRTATLLNESRELAEMLSSQEEEMRQNMEELQATQEELQRNSSESEEFMEIFNQYSVKVEFDQKGTILNANDKFVSLVQHPKSNLISMHLYDVLPTHGDKYGADFWKEVVKNEIKEIDLPFKNKAGNTIMIKAFFKPVEYMPGFVRKVNMIGYQIEVSTKVIA